MRIERVDDQLQQLIDFSLKFTFRHRSRSPIGKYKTPECRIHPRIWTVEERHGNGAESAPLGWLPLFPPPRNLDGRRAAWKWSRKCSAWMVATLPSPQESGCRRVGGSSTAMRDAQGAIHIKFPGRSE